MPVRDTLRSLVPLEARHRIAVSRLRYRVPTAAWRGLPDALVIGAQRAGTSSLYRHLGAHPQALPAFRKEVEVFSRSWPRDEAWYRAHFALRWRRGLRFEATPDYLLHPYAAERAAALLPGAKIVVLLRDPVARAWSHHGHMVRLGYEVLPFPDALAAEADRCGPELARLAEDPGYDAKALLRFSYALRGRYAEQLARWFAHYPRERVLVVRSEDLFASPAQVFAQVVAFLGLRPWQPAAYANVSRSARTPEPSSGPDEASAARLRAELADDVAALPGLLRWSAPMWPGWS